MEVARMLLWCMPACMVVPVDDVVRDALDLVELNHVFDAQGQPVFDQIIFYEWCDAACRFQVRDWRLVKSAAMRPQRDWQRGCWWVLWQEDQALRSVHARSFRETWTQYDPEMVEREVLPAEARRKLTAPR
jgi:hypothetical protein